MKLCELHLLKKSLNINPVLLLDDVLSELDLQRESTVLKIVGNRFQTFITTSNFGYAEYVEKNHGLQMQKFIIKDNEASIT